MPQKRRVLFAVSTLGGGGAERQVISILRHLDRRRFEPALYLIQRKGELLDQLPNDVPVWAFAERHPQPGLYFPGRIHRQQIHDLVQLIQQQSFDVLYERMYFMTMIGAAAARRQPIQRIAVIDSNPHYDLPRTAGRFRFIKRRLLRQAYAESTRCVAVSECVRRKAAEYYRLDAESIGTCLNFIDIDRIDECRSEQPAAWDANRFHVVAIGRMQEEKGFHLLIDAVEQLVKSRGRRQLLLHMLGTGRQQAALREQTRQVGLEDHIQFHGFVANPYPVLASANVFCLSSLYEGLPTVLLEAMACRAPVVATDCACGPSEILQGGQLGKLIEPGSVAALVDGLEWAMANPDQLRERLEPARKHVETVYSLAAGIARVEALIESAGARGRGSAGARKSADDGS